MRAASVIAIPNVIARLCLVLVVLIAACDEQPRSRSESQTTAIVLQAPDRATVGDEVQFVVELVSKAEPEIVEIIDQELGEDLLVATAQRIGPGRYEARWTPTLDDEGPYTLRAKALLETGSVLLSEQQAMSIEGSELTPFAAQLKKESYTPTGLRAVAALGLVTLSWDPVGRVTGYYVYRSTTEGFAPTPAERVGEVASPAFVDTEVQDGTTYFYRVSSFRLNRRSKKVAESMPSVEVSAQPGDSEAPVVSITDPAKDTTYTGAQQVTILASASDNAGIVMVEFYDGAQLFGTDTTAPYSVDWAFTGADNGAHAWTAKAHDAAGNSTTSAVRTLTVAIKSQDTTPPKASITAPGSDTTLTAAQTVQVTASATDDVGVAKLELYQGSALMKTFVSAPYSYSWSITAADNGVHEWIAKAFDAAGNSSTSAVRTLTVDILAKPAPPTGVTAAAGDQLVTITFKGGSNATSHNIYWATTAGVKKGTGQKIAGVKSPFLHTPLINGVTYHYVVTAVNAAGESVESTEVSAKPKAAAAPDAGVPDTGGTTSDGSPPSPDGTQPPPGAVLYGQCDGLAVCAGNDRFVHTQTPVTLAGSTTGSGSTSLTYAWTLLKGDAAGVAGGKLPSTSPSPTVTFTKGGLYLLQLEISKDGTSQGKDTMVVYATDPSADNTQTCKGQTGCHSGGVYKRTQYGDYAYKDSSGTWALCDETCRDARWRVGNPAALGFLWHDTFHQLFNGIDAPDFSGTGTSSDNHQFWEAIYHDGGAIDVKDSNVIVERITVRDGSDGIKIRDVGFYTVRDCYIHHAGDDAIENDYRNGGLIDDVLIEGAWMGVAIRARSSVSTDGGSNLLTIKDTMVALIPQHGVYKAKDPVPGHANFIKWESAEPSKQPKVLMTGNIFLAGQGQSNNSSYPGGSLELTHQQHQPGSKNNLVIWLGPALSDQDVYKHVDIPSGDGFIVTRDPSIWIQARADWFARHPYIAKVN